MMKHRTPNHNALVSIIPFFGLTSFYYLGKKKGLISYGLTILGSFSVAITVAMLGGIVMGIPINQLTLFLVIFPSQNILQYFIIRHFTAARNDEPKILIDCCASIDCDQKIDTNLKKFCAECEKMKIGF